MEMFWAGERRAGPGIDPSHTHTLRLCPHTNAASWCQCKDERKDADEQRLRDRLGPKGQALRCLWADTEFRRKRSEATAWKIEKENASSCRARSQQGGWADPHTVWTCHARVYQGLCSASTFGRSSCQSSHCPPISKLPLHWLVSLASCPGPRIPVVHSPWIKALCLTQQMACRILLTTVPGVHSDQLVPVQWTGSMP